MNQTLPCKDFYPGNYGDGIEEMPTANTGWELREILLIQKTGSGLMAKLSLSLSGTFLVGMTIVQGLMELKDGFGQTPAASLS